MTINPADAGLGAMKMSKEHLEPLHKESSAFHDECVELERSGETEELLKIIRRPPSAEITFTQEIVKALRTQVQSIPSLQAGLLSTAKLVSTK